ncbi:hypothetical protein ACJJTC_003642 [Scirpophaga incertulas]
MNFVEVASLYLLLRRIRRKKNKNRQYWIHPFTSDRIINGFFYKKYHNLRMYPKKFFNYYRMKILTFDRLLRIVGPYIVGPLETKTPLKMQVPTCLFLNGQNTNEEPAGREPAILETQCARVHIIPYSAF